MLKADMPFNSMEWEKTEDGLFASNRKTGELILLSRFEDGYRRGIESMHRHSDSINYQSMINQPDIYTAYLQVLSNLENVLSSDLSSKTAKRE